MCPVSYWGAGPRRTGQAEWLGIVSGTPTSSEPLLSDPPTSGVINSRLARVEGQECYPAARGGRGSRGAGGWGGCGAMPAAASCGPGRRAFATPTPTRSSAVPPPPPPPSPAQVRACPEPLLTEPGGSPYCFLPSTNFLPRPLSSWGVASQYLSPACRAGTLLGWPCCTLPGLALPEACLGCCCPSRPVWLRVSLTVSKSQLSLAFLVLLHF